MALLLTAQLEMIAQMAKPNAQQTFRASDKAFKNAQTGDTIHFCHGGSFTTSDSFKWVNAKSTKGNPVTLKDYLPNRITQSPHRPIINLAINNRLLNWSPDC